MTTHNRKNEQHKKHGLNNIARTANDLLLLKMTTHYRKNEQHKCGLNKSRHKSVTGLNRLMKFHPDPLLDN